MVYERNFITNIRDARQAQASKPILKLSMLPLISASLASSGVVIESRIVGGRRGDSGKVQNRNSILRERDYVLASLRARVPRAHWKSRALKSCRLCSWLPFLLQSCSSNNCQIPSPEVSSQNRHTRMPFVAGSPVEMSDGTLRCRQHGLEIYGICCCDYTFMRDGSEEQEEANDTKQESDGEETVPKFRHTLCHCILIRRDTPDVFHL